MPSSCWAPNCSNRLRKGCTVKMYRFPQSNAERMNRWIIQIARLPPSGLFSNRTDGLHEPKDHDRLCSDHFVKGKPSNDPNDIDYIPTIFTTSSKTHVKQKLKKKSKLKDKSDSTNKRQWTRSCEKQAADDDSTTDSFASHGDDEREAAAGMCLLQDAVVLQETTSQPCRKPNRTLKVVQLNNLVMSLNNEKLGKEMEQTVKTQL